MGGILQQLGHEYVHRAGLEVVALSAISAALGPWIAMRTLAFFAHAIGTAAFPGLVAADAIGLAPLIGASASASAVAIGSRSSRSPDAGGTRTGLWLTAALAVGALLASREGSGGAAVETALFGSLLTVGWTDIAAAACVAVAAVVATRIGGIRWLDSGLTGTRRPGWDAVLLLLVAAAAVAQLAAAGSLLAAALLVLPAIAARPWTATLRSWHALTLAVALATGLGGLIAAITLDLPPGALIAIISGSLAIGSNLLHSLRHRTRGALVLAAVGLAAAVAGCTSQGGNGVVATTPIIGSITQTVAGPGTKVTVLVPSGSDPHEFEPRPSHIEAVAGAKLIVANGGLDSWIDRVHDRAGSEAPVLQLSGSRDPHWFHDPRIVATAASRIARALAELDPANASDYRRRAESLRLKAETMLAEARDCIARLPAGQRLLVTDHDAFGYLARATGLRQVGALIPSTSTAASPSARQLTDLTRQIESLRIKAIFPETSLDPKLARQVAARTGASASTQLDADTLGPAGSGRDTWAGMWATNIERITSALSGGRVTCRIGPG